MSPHPKTAQQRPMSLHRQRRRMPEAPANPLIKKEAPAFTGAKSNREASRLGDVGSEDPENPGKAPGGGGANPAGTFRGREIRPHATYVRQDGLHNHVKKRGLGMQAAHNKIVNESVACRR